MTEIKTTTVEMFSTEDGENFRSLEEAQKHQAMLNARVCIDSYIAAEHADSTERTTARIKNTIMSYEAYKAGTIGE